MITVRRSKTNPHGRLKDVVRIVAQDDDTCPVAAWRAWREVLDAAGVERGPLLRRVKNNKLTTAGRPPRDPERAGGIGDRTIRNLIRDTAAAAGLTRALDDDERRLLSTAAEAADLAALTEGSGRPSPPSGAVPGGCCGARCAATAGTACAADTSATCNGSAPPGM
ncbi:hypothetical protein ACWDCB_44145 [Streptomyces sp. NPDC001178]